MDVWDQPPTYMPLRRGLPLSTKTGRLSSRLQDGRKEGGVSIFGCQPLAIGPLAEVEARSMA